MKNNLVDHNSINYLLYRARLSFNYTIKEAATLLGISRLHLFLIEKGYLNVSNKLKAYFITLYNLSDDFFIKHTNFVTPIDKDVENVKKQTKFYKLFHKKKFKIIAYVSLAISLCAVSFGVYSINRRFLTPRVAWTEKFTDFYTQMKKDGTPEKSILDLDTVYKLTYSPEARYQDDNKIDTNTIISTYDKETSAARSNIDFTYALSKKNETGTYDVYEEYGFYLFTFNKRKAVFIYYQNYVEKIKVESAVMSIEDDLTLNLRAFDYYVDDVLYRAKKNSEAYNKFVNYVSTVLVNETYPAIRDAFQRFSLPYITTTAFLTDVQTIARDNSFFNRLGLFLIITFSLMSCLAIVLGALSYYASYRLKPKKETVEFQSPLISRDIPIRRIYNDTKFPTIIPEFMVKAIGLTFLAFSSATLFLSVYSLFNADLVAFDVSNNIRKLTSNFLVSAVLLLFFIKLDVYARKDIKSLLINIIALFIAGLLFYIIEILMYRAIVIEGDIVSVLLQAITNIIPGNVIWNIMLYSLIFFFLFTHPKKYDNKPAKLLKWRLLSLIPTFILLFALFYKAYLEKMITSAFYISFLFHTSGIISTMFAILYIYSLYFLRLRNRLTFGEKNEEIYSYSRYFALEKNILACIIIAVLFGIDMFFRFKVPNNDLKLGNNWSIAALIPVILFYRPHVGKRNAHWDNTYTILYGATFAGGYVAVALYILISINISDILFILF